MNPAQLHGKDARTILAIINQDRPATKAWRDSGSSSPEFIRLMEEIEKLQLKDKNICNTSPKPMFDKPFRDADETRYATKRMLRFSVGSYQNESMNLGQTPRARFPAEASPRSQYRSAISMRHVERREEYHYEEEEDEEDDAVMETYRTYGRSIRQEYVRGNADIERSSSPASRLGRFARRVEYEDDDDDDYVNDRQVHEDLDNSAVFDEAMYARRAMSTAGRTPARALVYRDYDDEDDEDDDDEEAYGSPTDTHDAGDGDDIEASERLARELMEAEQQELLERLHVEQQRALQQLQVDGAEGAQAWIDIADGEEDDEGEEVGNDYDELLELGERLGDVRRDRWRERSSAVIARLPVLQFSEVREVLSTYRDEICIICQDDFACEPDRKVMLMPRCTHSFHVECVTAWIADNDKCPTCKAPVERNEA